MVHLYTKERADGSQLFTVLNNRGRALSSGDLLRTHTLAVLGAYPGQQSGAEYDWDEILRYGDRFVNKFLVTYYVSVTGERPPPAQVVTRFRRRFLNAEIDSAASATRLRLVVAELREEAETFSRIRGGDWPFAESKVSGRDRGRLGRLVGPLHHDLAHPLLLAVAREVDDEKAFRYLVGALELFVFRYINVVGGNADRLSRVYYDHARLVRENGKLAKKALRNTLRRFIRDYAPDDLFELHLRELRFESNARQKVLIRHFLTTIDDYEDWFQSGATGPRRVNTTATVYDLNEVNIEHIYPQRPRKKIEELEQVKHALGNLTPLDERDGKIAGNADFEAKKPVYEKSRFYITKELTAVENWDAAAVADRFVFYADRAKKIFAIR